MKSWYEAGAKAGAGSTCYGVMAYMDGQESFLIKTHMPGNFGENFGLSRKATGLLPACLITIHEYSANSWQVSSVEGILDERSDEKLEAYLRVGKSA